MGAQSAKLASVDNQGEREKDMARTTKVLILASGQALTSLVAALSAAILARVFTQADYATYRQMMLAYTFAAPFVMLGLHQALFYFLPNEKERVRGVLVENLMLLGAGGLLLGLFLVAGGNHLLARRFHNPALVPLLLLIAPFPLLLLPSMSLNACMISRGRTAQVAVYNIASRLVMLLAVVIPCWIWPWPVTAAIGTVVGTGATTAVALGMMFRACQGGPWFPTRKGMIAQLRFGVPLGLSTLIGTTSRSLDQVFVAAMCTPAAFAIFVNGAVEIPLIGIITGSVTSVLVADYAKLYREGRHDDIIQLMHRAMLKCGLVLIPTMAFLLCMAPELMRLVFGVRYAASATPFQIYCLLLPLRTLSFNSVFTATGNSKYVLAQTLLPLAGKLVFTSFIINHFGPNGAALSTVLVTYALTIPYVTVFLSRILKSSCSRLFPWKGMLGLGVASFLSLIPLLLLKRFLPMPDIVSVAVSAFIYVLLAIPMLSWFNLLDVKRLIARLQTIVVDRFARAQPLLRSL